MQNSKMTLRFPPPSGHTQYNPLPLSIGGTCEDVDVCIPLIRLWAGWWGITPVIVLSCKTRGGWREILLLAPKTWATKLSEPLDTDRDPCRQPTIRQGPQSYNHKELNPNNNHMSPEPKLQMGHCWHLNSAPRLWAESLAWPCPDFWPINTVRW